MDRLRAWRRSRIIRSEEHTSELQSPQNLVCRLLLEKKKDGNMAQHSRNQASATSQARYSTHCAPATHSEPARHAWVVGGVPLADIYFFFFNDTATTEIYTLSLRDALPICNAAPPSSAASCRSDILEEGPSGC